MIEDRILVRAVESWSDESQSWRTDYERVEVQIRWPGNSESFGNCWQLERRRQSPNYYTCNGSPGGCEGGRFGHCEYCSREKE